MTTGFFHSCPSSVISISAGVGVTMAVALNSGGSPSMSTSIASTIPSSKVGASPSVSSLVDGALVSNGCGIELACVHCWLKSPYAVNDVLSLYS